MDSSEMQLILDQLIKVEPALEGAEQYQRCYAVYVAMDKSPEDWVIQEFLDPVTLVHRWFWRRKS